MHAHKAHNRQVFKANICTDIYEKVQCYEAICKILKYNEQKAVFIYNTSMKKKFQMQSFSSMEFILS